VLKSIYIINNKNKNNSILCVLMHTISNCAFKPFLHFYYLAIHNFAFSKPLLHFY